MINTVPGFTERSVAQEFPRAGSERVRKLVKTRCCEPFAKERIERFDLQGGNAMRGVESRKSAKALSGTFVVCAGTLIPPGYGFESVRAE
jgi:hypothetical protein